MVLLVIQRSEMVWSANVNRSYEMDLSKAFEIFKNDLFSINIQEAQTRKISNSLIEENIKNVQKIKEKSDIKFYGQSHTMWFHRADCNEIVHYGTKDISTEEITNLLIKDKNRQFQWQLAEAYEAYEDFIERVYAYVGASNNAYWKSDQKVLLNNNDNIDTCLSIIKDEKNRRSFSQKCMLNQLRHNFTEITKLESTNVLKCNLKFYLSLIEQLRHQIIHTRGVITREDIFIKKVFEGLGIADKDDLILLINIILDKNKSGVLHINLLERQNTHSVGYKNIAKHLRELLLTHAHLIYEVIRKSEINPATQVKAT